MTSKRQWSVREAKAHFSELIDAASKGKELVITVHGKPAAKVVPYTMKKRRAMKVDMEWLMSMPMQTQSLSQDIIREDRDARG